MYRLEVARNGQTNQFSIVLTQGTDNIHCMVSVAAGTGNDDRADEVKENAALGRAKMLAHMLAEAIEAHDNFRGV